MNRIYTSIKLAINEKFSLTFFLVSALDKTLTSIVNLTIKLLRVTCLKGNLSHGEIIIIFFGSLVLIKAMNMGRLIVVDVVRLVIPHQKLVLDVLGEE